MRAIPSALCQYTFCLVRTCRHRSWIALQKPGVEEHGSKMVKKAMLSYDSGTNSLTA